MDMKINIADKSGKSIKKEFKEDQIQFLQSKKIGDTFHGELIEMPGYEFEISGGSDYCGFPMRRDVNGIMRKQVLVTTGFGNKYKREGMRLRRTVAGNTVYNKTTQINLKVVKYGSSPLITSTEDKKE